MPAQETKVLKVSNCCGARPSSEYDEYGFICSDCGEHCDYVEEDE